MALLKIALVIFASPIVGYANNFDFFRSSSCTGVWQAETGEAQKGPFTPLRTVNELIASREVIPEGCMRSIDNVFPRIARTLHRRGGKMDFREISLFRFSVLIGALGMLLWCIDAPFIRFLTAAAFLLMLGDMSVLPYFNTLYLEYSVVAGVFFALATACAVTASAHPPRKRLMWFAVGALLWLGFSKQQYCFLASSLAVYFALVVFSRWRTVKYSMGFVGLAVAIPLVFFAMNSSKNGLMRDVVMANGANTFLAAVLPEAHDPSAALRQLGLPASCASAIGQMWFSPGFQQNNPCPDVAHVGRARLPGLFLQEPSIFFDVMSKGIVWSWPLYPSHLGMYASGASASSPVLKIARDTSLIPRLTEDIKPTYFFPTVVGSMVVGLVAIAATIALVLRRKPTPAWVLWTASALGLGGCTALFAIASSVFGDGYSDIQKHAVGVGLGLNLQASAVVALCCVALAAACKKLRVSVRG